jgi:uncharacterized protein
VDSAHDAFNPVRLLILQASPFCNIDCAYCYLSTRSDTKRISQATIEAIGGFLREVVVAAPPLTICWHAGEPLTVPIAFYERAFTTLRDTPGIPAIRHSFQTNATLINDDWCDFFKRWSVHLGVSCDGPRAIHDSQRLDRAGRGTFDRVIRGISKLRERDVPFGVISVLTDKSLHDPDGIWNFYRSNGIKRVAFNVDESKGVHQESSLTAKEHLSLFRKFISRIAELQGNEPVIAVRELDVMRRQLSASPDVIVRKTDNRPGAILNINADGDITTFSPELLGQDHPRYGRFAWGNVHTDSWSQFARNAQLRRARADIEAGVELCRQKCPYFSVCGGGCPSNKLAEHDTFAATETMKCRFKIQTVADVVLERLEREMGLSHAHSGTAQ